MLLIAMTTQAQKTVTGTVTDSKGEPLYGVTVTVKSGKAAAVTDLNGRYTLKVDADDAVLVFRFIGMEPYQASVKGVSTINVKLQDPAGRDGSRLDGLPAVVA